MPDKASSRGLHLLHGEGGIFGAGGLQVPSPARCQGAPALPRALLALQSLPQQR